MQEGDYTYIIVEGLDGYDWQTPLNVFLAKYSGAYLKSTSRTTSSNGLIFCIGIPTKYFPLDNAPRWFP